MRLVSAMVVCCGVVEVKAAAIAGESLTLAGREIVGFKVD